MEFRRTQITNDHEHEEDQRIIERPDSQAAPNVEILEVALRFLGFDEDAGNQKPGQYKKKIDSHPSIAEQLLRMKHGILEADVMHHHEQNRQTADGIELGNSSWHSLRRVTRIGAATARPTCCMPAGLLTNSRNPACQDRDGRRSIVEQLDFGSYLPAQGVGSKAAFWIYVLQQSSGISSIGPRVGTRAWTFLRQTLSTSLQG